MLNMKKDYNIKELISQYFGDKSHKNGYKIRHGIILVKDNRNIPYYGYVELFNYGFFMQNIWYNPLLNEKILFMKYLIMELR